ncbi:MAG: hypothetical protein PHW54_05055 [Candidatus Omnitrophica bacterium]|nr:hypothetical protein [Candidatus Omnitrophota bacterium]
MKKVDKSASDRRLRIRALAVATRGQFSYKEKDLLGGWKIEVINGIVHIGNIRKNPNSGAFQYYHGPNNILNYAYEEMNLDTLKQRIESEYK